ncbi:hypothetical protein B0J13DRAFT_655498 [Dactylonectria estremocensis]|uniref:Uncharacterized protein n=1 Tax=Dactylonectria estremocensis TaxID=1079267 RepID=A0A9P9J807_9HYPO|nr:hypothetical protein B0J13DRAFT_655498 [Dactylonectria estremocensis]
MSSNNIQHLDKDKVLAAALHLVPGGKSLAVDGEFRGDVLNNVHARIWVIQNKRNRVIQGKVPGLSLKDDDDQKALHPRVLAVNGQTGYDKTGRVVDHSDIRPDKIILDEEYNIS